MITITMRPYTGEEKERLKNRLPSLYNRVERFLTTAIVFFAVMMLPVSLLYQLFGWAHLGNAVIVMVAIAIGAALAYRRRKNGLSNQLWIDIIENGTAEVAHIKTTRVIERREYDDEGLTFYVEVQHNGKPKTLVLSGQYFYELQWREEGESPFPVTEFTTIREADTRELLDIQLTGKHFKPEMVFEPYTDEEFKFMEWPTDGDILDTTLDELIEAENRKQVIS